ncbi:MAG: hypothetical protein JSW26_07635 [Desulfobacterales bacterium]|nr:MAG: hypothetical protein JSW26_07635 [Desulfobacterales bacterium]
MDCIKDPVEQTTAITDIILAAVALGGILFLHGDSAGTGDDWKIIIWSAAIGLIGLAAVLGAAAHGLVLSQARHQRVWQVLNMALALAVSLFVVGVVLDLWGPAASYKALPVMLISGLGFYLATLVYPGIFFVFVVYEALALFFALGAYVFLSVQGEVKGAGLMAAGILISIFAAGIQAKKSISLTLIWKFDHNGIYHLLQVVGLILLLIGLRWSVQY